MHDGALRGLDVDAERSGDGVRHREEVERDLTERDVRAVLDLTELRRLDAELGELSLDKAQGELAREDGHLVVEVLQKIRQGARMVLVAVRDHDTAELLLVLKHVGIVRQHEVNAGLGVIGEHKAGVNEHHIGPALDHGHVLADAIEAAERDDTKGRILFCHD